MTAQISPFSHRMRQAALLLAGGLISLNSQAFSFYNSVEQHNYYVDIDGASDFKQTVSSTSPKSCHWSNTDCNPGGDRYNLLTANLHVSALDFRCKINFQAGGSVRLQYANGYLQCRSYDVNGSLRDVNPVNVSANQRRVRFLATADPQYDNGNHSRNLVSNDTLAVMGNMIKSSDDIRGLLVAGDLTQNSRKDEREFFEDATWRIRDYLYEGMGNHDDENPDFWQRLACPLIDSCVSPGDIMDSIDHPRSSVLQEQQHEGGLYSWDWQDVHLVQLGTFIANAPKPTDSIANFGDYEPYKSLDFLKDDLARNVGNSGRPVILMSHYGFDGFSKGWWNEAQRKAMWEALDGYNVVAIFSGHSHRHPTSQWHFRAYRPSGTSKGPTSILNVVAGAALYKAFVDVTIVDNTMTVTRRSFDGNKNPTSVGSTSISLNKNYQASAPVMSYKSLDNNQCLKRAGDSLALGDCNDGERFSLESNERLRHLASGLCVSAVGGNTYVRLRSCDSSDQQKWYWSGKQLKNRAHNQCLDRYRSANKAGVWGCHGGDNQYWANEFKL